MPQLPAPPPPGEPVDRPPSDLQRDRSGRRRNDVSAAAFAPMVDIDPRLGPALLEALQRVGIAAYVEPVGGSVGGYCEIRLPSRPTDRLWTDLRQREVARSVVVRAPADGAVAAPTADSAWESVLLAGRLPLDPGPRPWPTSEDVEATSPLAREPGEPAHIEPPPSEHADADEGYDDEEEHFVPPPPPPLPRIQGPTLVALLAMSLIHI